MSLIANHLSFALEQLERGLATGSRKPQLEWQGERFPCVPLSITRATDLVEGGFEARIGFPVFIRKNSFLRSLTADSDQVTVDSDQITADDESAGREFGEELTVDSTEVTVDSDLITVDSQLRIPGVGQKVRYENREYRVIEREDNYGAFYKFVLGDPHR